MTRAGLANRFCDPRHRLRWLAALAVAQGCLYAVLTGLSHQFDVGTPVRDRPIVAVLGLLGACFALYIASLVLVLRCRPTVRLATVVIGSAIVLRLILLFSTPIQEIDIYRYLWDGAVSSRGVSPFRYAPAEVLAADVNGDLPAELRRLAVLPAESPPMAEILRRIHYAELPTVYPPVSQFVFAIADRLVPPAAPVWIRVTGFKAVLGLFDVATVLLLWWLLTEVRAHPGWTVAYAWCPLVLKEFANSGHLDTIAVCLTTAAILAAVRGYRRGAEPSGRWQAAAGVFLGLAIGAKLYPVVLLPLLTVMSVRGAGWSRGVVFLSASLTVAAISLAPMLPSHPTRPTSATAAARNSNTVTALPPPDSGTPAASPGASVAADGDSLAGLQAFLSRWEMNDFLFMIVIENLRPASLRPGEPEAWFSVLSDAAKWNVISPVARALHVDPERAAFLSARLITAAAFLLIVLWLIGNAVRTNSSDAFLEAGFLTLAWFWLLAPTQNPWYWTWAIPLIPFARGRAWFAMSGLVLIYYLRFWLIYHWPDTAILGTAYAGARFFDYVVAWVEYAPWLLWLFLAAWICRSGRSGRLEREEPDSADDCESLHRSRADGRIGFKMVSFQTSLS